MAADHRTGVVLMAYGTPGRPEEIEGYYTDIRRGRPPTAEQLGDLVRRYEAIGGTSPLAQRTEAQRAALQHALDQRGPGRFDVVLGLKHASPTIEDSVAALATLDVDGVVGLVLAPHYSAFSVGQYLERAGRAADTAGLAFRGVSSWHLEPAYLDFLAGEVDRELAALPPSTTVLFSAHSLPEDILATGDPYPDELHETAAAVAARSHLVGRVPWRVAYQSAGRTRQRWLGPDILTVIDQLGDAGQGDPPVEGVLVCACGFVADHLEVLYDLDVEARRRAQGHGLAFARTACVNDDRTVIEALAGLVDGARSAPPAAGG